MTELLYFRIIQALLYLKMANFASKSAAKTRFAMINNEMHNESTRCDQIADNNSLPPFTIGIDLSKEPTENNFNERYVKVSWFVLMIGD